MGQEWGPEGRFFSMYPAAQPHQYYYPVMPHQIYYLLSPTDATILLHTNDSAILLYTTDATIYSRPALLTKIEQGTYITFDASAPVLIYLNTSCLNTSLVFCREIVPTRGAFVLALPNQIRCKEFLPDRVMLRL